MVGWFFIVWRHHTYIKRPILCRDHAHYDGADWGLALVDRPQSGYRILRLIQGTRRTHGNLPDNLSCLRLKCRSSLLIQWGWTEVLLQVPNCVAILYQEVIDIRPGRASRVSTGSHLGEVPPLLLFLDDIRACVWKRMSITRLPTARLGNVTDTRPGAQAL